MTFSTAAVATALAAEAASASLPASWLPATIMAARQFAGATAGAVSTKVVSLVQGVCRTMLVKKLTTIGAILLVVALAGFGAGTLYLQTAMAGPPGEEQGANPAVQNKPQDDRAELRRLKEELQQLRNKAAALEARVTQLERAEPELLFRGKPASYWIKQLRDRDPKFRQDALIALGGIAEVDHSLIPFIVASLLGDREDGVRDTAANQLAQIVGEPALALLVAALKDAKQHQRIWILATLDRMDALPRSAVPTLTALLKSPTEADRIGAAKVLGRIGHDAAPAVPALIPLLKARSTFASCIAATALERIGPAAAAAVPQLIDMLQDTQSLKFPYDASLQPLQPLLLGSGFPTPALVAAKALGAIGPAAKAALPALRALRERLSRPPSPGQGLSGASTAAIYSVDEAISKIDSEARAPLSPKSHGTKK